MCPRVADETTPCDESGYLLKVEAMGFSVSEAENALRKSKNNNFGEAIRLLLEERGKSFSESPWNVVMEAEDPYGLLKAKKRPEVHSEKDPSQGGFRLDESSSAAEILDARLKDFKAMGFGVEDAERALAATQNNIDEAINLLLNQNTGRYFSESPHDVLVEAPDPYKKTKKASTDNIPDPRKRDNFTQGLPANAPVAAIVDSRLSLFSDMGFSIDNAEKALQAHDNDINKALNSLLQEKKQQSL